MKFCIQCGSELPEEAKFCRNCGATVDSPDSGMASDTHYNAATGDVETVALDAEGEFVGADWSDAQSKKSVFVKDSEASAQGQQPVQPQQPMPQPPMQQQPQQQWPQQPQQPMQQPQQQWPQQPQQQWQQPQQQWPTEEKRSIFGNKGLWAVLGLIPLALVAAFLFKGNATDKADVPNTPNTVQEETFEQILQDKQEQLVQDDQQGDVSQYGDMDSQEVTIAKFTFTLPDEYKVEDRMIVEDNEAVLIVPKGAADHTNRLILRYYQDELEGINGITNEEIGDMLTRIMDANAGVIARNVTTEKPYKVQYDDNADGTYFPHCYSYMNFTNGNGARSWVYGEATLIKRSILCGVAVATDEAELRALTDIYMEVVQAANN